MYIGADYYPEHWPRNRWETDARLMKKAGFNVVRLAEFSWVMLEPEEGRYEFDWLDDAINVLGRQGISVILGTPTAVMPAWLARKYPNALAVQNTGQRIVWGLRKNNCFTNGAYRLLSERITRAMAGHYHNNPRVIGWQTDNEINGPHCYCDTCRAEWQDWLRARYGSLQTLNQAWGTHFWGHFYQTWGEIQTPTHEHHNPSACLDWRRFNSWLNIRFQHEQVVVLRSLCPRHFITHNFMAFGTTQTNPHDLAMDLDVAAWDNYPVWADPEIKYGAACGADLVRSLKKKNFWIMEQTAGGGGWDVLNRNPRPGEIRNIALQQVAHGADAMVWFRWRTCTAGREQYWHGILGHDGKPGRRYRECTATARDLHKLAPLLANTTLKPKVAIVYDQDSRWAFETQRSYKNNEVPAAIRRYYDAFFRAGINVDIIRPSDPLTGYKVIVAPELFVLPDATASKLCDFVRAGGVLLTDLRTGVMTETCLAHTRTLPGLLTDVLGITIEEYEGLNGDKQTYPLAGTDAFPGAFTSTLYADWIKPGQAEVLARYDAWHLKSYAALTRHRHGKGTGYYLGTIAAEPAFYDALIKAVLDSAKLKPVLAPPPGIEITLREGASRKLLFIINHLEQAVTMKVPAGNVELLSGRRTGPSLTLDRYGAAVIRLK